MKPWIVADDPAGVRRACLLACILCIPYPGAAVEGVEPSPAPSDTVSRIFLPGASLPEFRVSLTPDALQRLRLDPREDVPADLQISETVFPGIRVHLKGRSGSFRPIDDLPSLTLSLSGQKGGSKLHLENSVEDPSRLHQWLGAALFREAGIPVPPVTLGHVSLNGRRLGLYVVRDGYDAGFLRRGIGSDAGALGEPEPGQDVDGPWHWKPGSASTDLRAATNALATLAAACRIPDPAARWKALDACLDVDRFATLIAGEVLLEHRDGYGLARNNVRIAWNPATGRLTFLPHGMDQLLCEVGFARHPQMAGEVARVFVTTDEGRHAYDGQWTRLIDEWMDPVRLESRVRTRVAGLEGGLTPEEAATLKRESADLIRRISRRCAEVALQRSRSPSASADFASGPVTLHDWTPVDIPVGGSMTNVISGEGRSQLRVIVGPITAASWQARMTLPAGRYRFEGIAGVRDLRPLPFGRNQGAALRVSGDRRRSLALTDDASGSPLRVDFTVPPPGEDLLFHCEVRASAGEAWFESGSLRVLRME